MSASKMPDIIKISHSLDLGPLPDELIPIARRQGEDPDMTCNYLEELRNLIYERGDFKPFRTDNEFLIKFLRARFFKVENAYKLLVRYHEFRESNQDLYLNVDPLSLTHLGENDIVSVTPYYDQNGRRMMFHKVGNWKPSKIPINDLMKATLILLEMGSLEPSAQVLGGIGIFDLEGLTINHGLLITPSVASKIICLMVTCMPIRTDTIHIVNQGWAFDMVFKMFKPFLNEKMRSRIFFHGTNMASLHNHIDKKHLPSKYGGYMDDYPYTTWMDNLKQNYTVVRELQQLGYAINADQFCSEIIGSEK
ncbi:clavesin-1-like isoform X2 [Bradysia coprophila]|uniref:clavesin-1-like isoform X2 n=1 Tax=Bradysia coprophila TaxID=38358 RepID=UPI00187D90F0|nr:clavesin-1-like isoform X2 [Bradysia coprophila]